MTSLKDAYPPPVITVIGLVASAVGCYIVASYLVYWALYRRYAAPGPPRLPILGNLLQLPSELHFIQYTKWAQEYGAIFSLDVFNQHIVVVNSFKVANELFDQRSNIHNDRPRSIMAGEILGGGMFLPFMKTADLWRRMRRAAHESFNPRAVERYQSMLTDVTISAILRTIADPQSWETNIQSIATTSIFSSVYGWPALKPKTTAMQFYRKLITHLSNATLPGAYLVDALPLMNLLPLSMARWKREGLIWHDTQSQTLQHLNSSARENIELGEDPSCFVSELIAAEGGHGLPGKAMSWLSGVMIVGGVDTVAVTLCSCVLAFLHYPDVLQKAHHEPDMQVGRERAPCFEDKDRLPYLRAIISEALRWYPPAPLGMPHASTEDSWYGQYFIPKGTIVLGNICTDTLFHIRAVQRQFRKTGPKQYPSHRDPSVHVDPDVFRPERFLDVSGKLKTAWSPETHHMGHTSFGFGKRICPGMHFAEQELFISLAIMLWTFDIQPLVDEKGERVLPPTDQWVDATIVVRPVSFECTFFPRFPAVQDILETSVTTV